MYPDVFSCDKCSKISIVKSRTGVPVRWNPRIHASNSNRAPPGCRICGTMGAWRMPSPLGRPWAPSPGWPPAVSWRKPRSTCLSVSKFSKPHSQAWVIHVATERPGNLPGDLFLPHDTASSNLLSLPHPLSPFQLGDSKPPAVLCFFSNRFPCIDPTRLVQTSQFRFSYWYIQLLHLPTQASHGCARVRP